MRVHTTVRVLLFKSWMRSLYRSRRWKLPPIGHRKPPRRKITSETSTRQPRLSAEIFALDEDPRAEERVQGDWTGMCGTSAAWTESTVGRLAIVASWSERERDDEAAGDGLQRRQRWPAGDPGAASVKRASSCHVTRREVVVVGVQRDFIRPSPEIGTSAGRSRSRAAEAAAFL